MSENYIVSARKYRPASFGTVVGQQALTHTLKTAIASQKLAHAYLFCGPRGVGKTTCARIFAKAINCEHLTADGEPCNECESCRAFNEQRSYNIVELDAASNNSVDDIRALVDQVRIPPQVGRYRVFIIDEVHMLSTSAFNAFLKTLEEPPEYAIFILATTEKQKIIPTILSRCQIYDFARIKVPDIVQQLQYICQDRGVEAESAALNVIAQKADGAMRDALSIFDQVSASSEGHITYKSTLENLNVLDYDYYFRLDEAFLQSNVPEALLIYKEIRDHGFDSQFFVNGLAQHIRDLMVASNPQTVGLLEMNADIAQKFVLEAQKFAPAYYYRAMELCNYCDLHYRDASNKQFLVELTLIKICQLITDPIPPAGGNQPRLQKIQTTGAPVQSQQATAPAPAPRAQAAAQPVSAAPTAPQPAAYRPAVAAQPAAPATRVPGPAPKANLGPKTSIQMTHIYVNNPAAAAAQAAQEQAAKNAANKPVGRNPFTVEKLHVAWKKYAMEHQKDIIVSKAMKDSLPKPITDVEFEVRVASDVVANFMRNKMSDILMKLRQELDNDMVTIKITVDEAIPAPKILTPKELVNDLKARHPEFDEVIREFGLRLA